MSTPIPSILLASAHRSTTSAVQAALTQSGHNVGLRCCENLTELPTLLQSEMFEAVLVDIDPDPAAVLPHLASLSMGARGARFVVLCERFSGELVRAAMKAGADDFITKADLSAELSRTVNELCADRAPEHRGSVVSVFSAGGGAGATTLAVNVATELAHQSGEPTLVVDLDFAYGTVARYLGLRSGYTLNHLLEQEGHIDAELVRSTAARYDDRLHALINRAVIDPFQPGPIDEQRLEEVLTACRDAYRWTVIDAARVSMPMAARLGRMSRSNCIVAQMSVKDICTARALWQGLAENGCAGDRLRYVLNRDGSKQRSLTIREAIEALGVEDLSRIRNDYRSTSESINLGKPLAACARRSAARRDIAAIAEAIGQDGGERSNGSGERAGRAEIVTRSGMFSNGQRQLVSGVRK